MLRVCIATISLSACEAEPHSGVPPVQATVTDSAGIRIVEYSEAALAAAPLIGVVGPLTRIKKDDAPNYAFYRVTAGAIGPDSTLVIANNQPPELRAFNVRGDLLWTAGGEGRGPGEFLDLADVVGAGDAGLMALDRRQRRVEVFSWKGAYLNTTTLAWPGPSGPSKLVHASGSGIATLTGWTSMLAADSLPLGYSRLRQPVHLFDTSGAYVRTPVSPLGLEFFSPQPNGWMVPLFQARTFVVGRGDELVVGDGVDFELRALNLAGELLSVTRVNYVVSPLSPETVSRQVDLWVEFRNPTAEARQAARAGAAMLPTPERVPAYSEGLVDSEQTLWVGQYAQFEPPTLWWGFSPSGELVGRIVLPRDVRLLAVGRGLLLGVSTDVYDVETPVLYALESAAGTTDRER